MPTNPPTIDSIANAAALSPDEKKALAGIYFATRLKDTLELLLSLNANNPESVEELLAFFETQISKLTPQQKIQFDNAMEKRQTDIMKLLHDQMVPSH